MSNEAPVAIGLHLLVHEDLVVDQPLLENLQVVDQAAGSVSRRCGTRRPAGSPKKKWFHIKNAQKKRKKKSAQRPPHWTDMLTNRPRYL